AIGDGAIALYSPQTQQVSLLNMPDSGDYAGETRFLSDSNFMQAPITNYRIQEFAPCLLMTDGVSDAFFDSDNALKNAKAWQYLWQFLQQQNALADENALLACLDFWSKGNHDDRTLVAILEQ
ncbi:MAG TPA: protein phosphatase 2C domain-containing protein, partial [Agitococcus sp.]|nr:protein phosphatase 2C domain-containing protein [Agitococcus sp.]